MRIRVQGTAVVQNIGSLTLWQWNLGHILNFSSGAIINRCTFSGLARVGFSGLPFLGQDPFYVSFWLFDESLDLFVLFILFGGLFFRHEGALKMAQNKMKNCAKSRSSRWTNALKPIT